MLTLRLCISDLAGDWTHDGASWRAGDSTIEPFRHRRLQSIAFASARRTAFAVRERRAGLRRDDDLRLAAEISDDEYARRIEALRGWDLDFVLLEIDRSENASHVSLTCGRWGTAPIYLCTVDGALHGDWDVRRLYPLLRSSALDPAFVAASLCDLADPYSSATIFPEILRLTERSTARWRAPYAGVTIAYPPPFARAMPSTLKQGADVARTFNEILAASVRRWIGDDADGIGAELSGGLDSTLSAAAAARLAPGNVRSYGMIMPGAPGAWQRERRNHAIAVLGLRDRNFPCQDTAPFTEPSRRLADHATVPWGEYYTEGVHAMLDLARGDGVDMMLTGVGGDELNELNHGEAPARAQTVSSDLGGARVPFWTQQTRDAFANVRTSIAYAPESVIQVSALEAIASVSHLFLAHGIWPVNPLVTPELIEFCRRLPARYRIDRDIERDALTAFGLGRIVTHPRRDRLEDFGDVMTGALSHSAAPLIASLFSESRLADAGYVDRDALIASYAAYRAGDARLEDAILGVLVLELTLRDVDVHRGHHAQPDNGRTNCTAIL